MISKVFPHPICDDSLSGRLSPLPSGEGKARAYCYILQCSDGSFYTGWTNDPDQRVKRHNAGHASKYTRSRLPVKLVYLEPQPDRIIAMKRERAIKKMTRDGKLKLIDGLNP